MLLVDITIVNVALPSIQRELDASLTGLQWVVDAYAITLAALILTAGALADRYGRRLLFAIGVALFSAASLLCGSAWSIASLDVARALQGVGGAALFATALALIGAEYQGRERAGAIAIWGSTIGIAVASGPLAGGLITEWLSWRWVFFVNVPIGVAVFVIALLKVRESRDPRADRTDYAGLVVFSASLFLIVYGLLRGNSVGWGSGQIVGALVVGAVLLVVFVLVERRQPRPMLDVSLFRVPAFVGVQLSTFCIGAGMFALFPFFSIYLQDILGFSPLKAGVAFLPFTMFVFLVPLATRNLAQTKPMWLLLAVAMTIVAVGLVLLELISPTSGYARAAARLHRGGHRHRPGEPDDRGSRAPGRRPGPDGDGGGDQQHRPHHGPRGRRRGARRDPAEPGRLQPARRRLPRLVAVGGRQLGGRARRARPGGARARRADRLRQRHGHDRPDRCGRAGDRRPGGGVPRAPGGGAEAGGRRGAGVSRGRNVGGAPFELVALSHKRPRDGDEVLVTGPGTIGLLAAQVARAAGGTVHVRGTPRDRVRLDAAGRLGFVTSTTDDGPLEADVVVECSGHEAGMAFGLESARRGGRYVVIGLAGKPM